jgi:hypothetical protein
MAEISFPLKNGKQLEVYSVSMQDGGTLAVITDCCYTADDMDLEVDENDVLEVESRFYTSLALFASESK